MQKPTHFLLFDTVYSLMDELNRSIKKTIQVIMLINFACLFNVILRFTKTSDQILMINLAATKEVFNNNDTIWTTNQSPEILLASGTLTKPVA